MYFHLDQQDRVLLATNDLSIQRWAAQQQGDRYQWQLEADLPIGPVQDAAGPGPTVSST